MKKIQSLSIRTLLMMISTILLNAIAVITAPIFTRILTVSDFGVFSLYSSWIAIFSIVFGIQTYGTLNNAKVEYDKKEYENYCVNVLLISIIGSVIWGCLIFICYPYINGIIGLPKKCLIWLLFGSCGTYLVNFINNYLLIEKKAVQNLLISIVVTLTITFGSIGLILNSQLEGYYARVLMHGGVYIISSLFIVYYFFGNGKIEIKLDYWKYCLRISLPLVVHGLSGILLAQSDRIMLMSFKGEEVVGIYSFCYTIALPVSVVASAINSAWTPEYYSLMHIENNVELQKHYGRQMFLVSGMCCGYILVAPEVLKILSTKDYWQGIEIVPIIIMGYFFNFLYLFPANYEFYNKQTKYIAVSTVGAAILNIVLNYLLIPEYGIFGAAVATILAYIMLFLIHDFIARKIIKGFDVSRRLYYKGLIAIAVCLGISMVLSNNAIVRWMFGGLIGLVIVLKINKQKAII